MNSSSDCSPTGLEITNKQIYKSVYLYEPFLMVGLWLNDGNRRNKTNSFR